MKILYLFIFLSICFAFKTNAQIQYGGRLMFHNVLIEWKPALTTLPESAFHRPGYQIGLFGAKPFGPRFEARVEANFSRMGYIFPTNADKVDYNYLGVSAIPILRVGGPFRFGLGATYNRLINDPDDVTPQQRDARPRNDFSLLAGLFLRYRRFEMQARGQLSLTEFNPGTTGNLPYFRTLGVGAAYFFRS